MVISDAHGSLVEEGAEKIEGAAVPSISVAGSHPHRWVSLMGSTLGSTKLGGPSWRKATAGTPACGLTSALWELLGLAGGTLLLGAWPTGQQLLLPVTENQPRKFDPVAGLSRASSSPYLPRLVLRT